MKSLSICLILSFCVSSVALATKSVQCQGSKKTSVGRTVVVVEGEGNSKSAEIRVFDGKTEGYKILGQYQVTKSNAPFYTGSPRTRFQDQNQKFFLTMAPKSNRLRATAANGAKLDLEIKCNEI